MIQINGLAYAFNSQKKIAFADFSVKQGEHLLLQGESGSGKTTLLHLLGGLLRSQQGKIEINGTDLASLTEGALDRFRGQHIGFIFQKNHLVNALSVSENLLLAPFLAGLNQDRNRVREVAGQLGLSEKLHDNVKTLSQGQAQRVAIGRAVLNKPSLILADEPTSSLDDKNCDKVIGLLLEASEQNKATLIVATHDHRLAGRFQNRYVLS